MSDWLNKLHEAQSAGSRFNVPGQRSNLRTPSPRTLSRPTGDGGAIGDLCNSSLQLFWPSPSSREIPRPPLQQNANQKRSTLINPDQPKKCFSTMRNEG